MYILALETTGAHASAAIIADADSGKGPGSLGCRHSC